MCRRVFLWLLVCMTVMLQNKCTNIHIYWTYGSRLNIQFLLYVNERKIVMSVEWNAKQFFFYTRVGGLYVWLHRGLRNKPRAWSSQPRFFHHLSILQRKSQTHKVKPLRQKLMRTDGQWSKLCSKYTTVLLMRGDLETKFEHTIYNIWCGLPLIVRFNIIRAYKQAHTRTKEPSNSHITD